MAYPQRCSGGNFYDKIERMEDTRNLVDEFKGKTNEEIVEILSEKRSGLEVAFENVSHDFNAGTIVRNANNFNASMVHVIGKKKYNRRGAMCTDKYLETRFWRTAEKFLDDQHKRGREVVAIENNVEGCKALSERKLGPKTTLLFGSESDGLSSEILSGVDDIRYIENFGSTRSVNVGVASGIAMYKWAQDNLIS